MQAMRTREDGLSNGHQEHASNDQQEMAEAEREPDRTALKWCARFRVFSFQSNFVYLSTKDSHSRPSQPKVGTHGALRAFCSKLCTHW